MRKNKKTSNLKFRQRKYSFKTLNVYRLLCLSLLISSTALITSCTSFNKKYSDLKEGQWEARTLIKDNVNSNTYIAIMNIYALKGQKLRTDLISPIGDHLGSLILTGKKVHILDVPNRKYYVGKPSETALTPLINIPLDPRLLHNIVFENPINQKGWKCKTEGDFLSECKSESKGLLVTWSNRAGSKRTVTFSHKTGSMQINFRKFDAAIEERIKFKFKVPKSFQKVKL